jgi:hypothetical protein
LPLSPAASKTTDDGRHGLWMSGHEVEEDVHFRAQPHRRILRGRQIACLEQFPRSIESVAHDTAAEFRFVLEVVEDQTRTLGDHDDRDLRGRDFLPVNSSPASMSRRRLSSAFELATALAVRSG